MRGLLSRFDAVLEALRQCFVTVPPVPAGRIRMAPVWVQPMVINPER